MAVYGAWQTGDWSSASTWAQLIQSSISQSSTGNALSATPTYSSTLTAANLVDSWRGFWLPFYNFATGNTVSVVLQEYNGATWSDTVATATLYSYSFTCNLRWGFAKFGTPYTPTTTSAGYYRLKITRATGSGNVKIYGPSASAPSCMIASASPASSPGAGDDVLIAGDMTNVAGTTNTITVTVDANTTIGSGQNIGSFPGASATSFNAIHIDSGGRVKASRTASATLIVRKLITQSYVDAEWDYGKTTDRIPAAYTATLMFDTSDNYSYVGVRYTSDLPNNTNPYYFGFVGAEKTYVKTNYVSGLGTAASPLITADAVDWSVGDQIVVTPSAGYATYAHTAPTTATYTDATGYNRRYITLTFAAAHSFKVGDRIVLSGFTPSAYNTTHTIDEVPSSTTLVIYGFTAAITANATVIGTVVGHTSKSEYRYIKTKNSSTSYVLSTISGGAEDALQYSPATTADIYNLSSNVRVTVNKRNQTYIYTFDAGSSSVTTSPSHWVLDNCRLDYGGGSGAYALGLLGNGYTAGSSSATISKAVFYCCLITIYDASTAHSDWSISDVIFAGYGASTNGIYAGGYNKTFTRVYSVDRSNTPITILGSNNIFRTIRMWSTAPEGNSAPGITITANAANNQIIGAYVQGIATGSSSRGVTLGNGVGNRFLDSEFGSVVANNNADVYITSNTYNICVFENCKFSSGTFISNYLNMFSGSLIAFHKYQQTTNKHRWYTNAGSARSTGAGLDDTTVRTAGSLNVRIDPENATTGFKMEFKIPSIVNQQTFINGFMQKNATFGTSVAKVEMWLPGSDTTSTADATYTLDNTTGSYQTFSVNKDYTGTANGLSTIRITAITATAGAYLYVADIYNGQGALNLWDNGQPVSPIVPLDFSSIPGLVWTFPDTNTTASTMGRALKDRLSKNQFLGLK